MSWELSLFDEEPPTPYGPKPVVKEWTGVGMRRATVVGGSGDRNRVGRGDGEPHPLGAPPLDWWVIDE